MDIYEKYRIDEALLNLLTNYFNSKLVIKLLELYKLTAVHGDSGMDTNILTELTNEEISNGTLKDMLLFKTKVAVNDLFKKYGISLYVEASIQTYLAVLELFSYLNELEPVLYIKMLEELAADESNNESLFSTLVSSNVDIKYIEIFESIEYVTDYYFDKLQTRYVDTDNDPNEDKLFILSHNNEGMKKTLMYHMLLSGEEIHEDINQYISIIIDKILDDDKVKLDGFHYDTLAKEIVSVLFIFQTDDIPMATLYKETIVDIIFGELSAKYQDNLSKYVNVEIDNILKNTRIYYD